MAENGYFDEEPLVAVPENLPSEFENLSYEELKNNKNINKRKKEEYNLGNKNEKKKYRKQRNE